MYMYVYTHTHMYMYIYIYMYSISGTTTTTNNNNNNNNNKVRLEGVSTEGKAPGQLRLGAPKLADALGEVLSMAEGETPV